MSTATNNELTKKRADEVFKIVGAVGFLLNSFNQLEFLANGQQSVFSMSLKYSAKKFIAELEKAERMLTANPDFESNEVMMQQMSDSYQVVDTLMTLMLEAGRILTPQSMELLNQDMVATAAKWGVKLTNTN